MLLRGLPLLSESAALGEETMERVYHHDRYAQDRLPPYRTNRRGLLRRWTLETAHPSLRNRRQVDRRCPGLEAVPATRGTGQAEFAAWLDAVNRGASGWKPVFPSTEVSAVDVLLSLGIGLSHHPAGFVDLGRLPQQSRSTVRLVAA